MRNKQSTTSMHNICMTVYISLWFEFGFGKHITAYVSCKTQCKCVACSLVNSTYSYLDYSNTALRLECIVNEEGVIAEQLWRILPSTSCLGEFADIDCVG